MLLLHQIGSVKVGEVVRYTLTYTPSLDRILPPPQHLHVKVKNTSAIPLRAAYLHGPYTLYASSYPSSFNPDVKHERVKEEGAPDYEPQIKAGGSWSSRLTIPEEIRASAEDGPTRDEDGERKSFTWIVEVASQVLFSTTAAVHFELLVGRDEKSVALGISGVIPMGQGQGVPGKLDDFQKRRSHLKAEVQTKGVFSKAVRLAIDDTMTLWNTPAFPSWDQQGNVDVKRGPEHGDKRDTDDKKDQKRRKQQKIHLVIVTHGLHSNLGADMLYIKESIDSAARQAREDAKQKRAELRARRAEQDNEFGREAVDLRSKSVPDLAIAPTEASEDEDDDEQVIVRGFTRNAVKTERGIQYLGKRLAKYVLSITYPDQPYLPVKGSISRSLTKSFTGQKSSGADGAQPAHRHSSIIKDEEHVNHNLAYQITSISFIGHSLGGLIQTYAVAYIQKHSPEFFQRIEPINFVAMASPFLGLSNENPVYVKFALDFGLIGRTGQDLGLTWRAPTIARNGWGAVVNGLVNDPHKSQQPNPGAKPLLRILPTGPAHQALKKFRNRTVYSNVVNDGIVPLRTSCLLFLDWRGLGRVEKARRENGLVGTMMNWGWHEMTGQNANINRKPIDWDELVSDDSDEHGRDSDDFGSAVPDARASQFLDGEKGDGSSDDDSISEHKPSKMDNSNASKEDAKEQESNMWNGFLSWFKPQAGSKPDEPKSSQVQRSRSGKRKKTPKIYHRGQTMHFGSNSDESESMTPDNVSPRDASFEKPRGPVRGSSLYTNNSTEENIAPPKTSVFESAGDLLSPPMPPEEFLLDPAARPRTIFHDRVYHPEDIPPPPTKRQKIFMRIGSRSGSRDSSSAPSQAPSDLDKLSSTKSEVSNVGTMKIEEKIARAYHKDMSWRKVLVSMEPDAHNNMIVRRMFANAYGWPVVKHMCDTHFAFTAAAQTRDEHEDTTERAKPSEQAVGRQGEQVKGQVDPPEDEQIQTQQDPEGKETRSKSVDAETLRSHSQPSGSKIRSQTSPRVSPTDLLLPSRVRSREQRNQVTRTPSEIRESHDRVPEITGPASISATGTFSTSSSSPNTSGGATAVLNKLVRQDSGRWSDRFFDDSADDASDVDVDDADVYLNQRRHNRPVDEGQWGNDKSTNQGPKGKDSVPVQHILTDESDQTGFVAEPDDVSSRASTRQDSRVDADIGLDPKTMAGLTSVGLGKAPDPRVLESGMNMAMGTGDIGIDK